MTRWYAELGGFVALMLSLTASADGVPTLDERLAFQASQAVVGTVPPDFTFRDRREQAVHLADYRGKPLIVNFIFTGCTTVCPTQTRTMHSAVKGLDRMLGPDQFNVVSIGFNLPFDSPRALRAFAAQNRIDYPNWEFLSPAIEDVAAISHAFGFSSVETPAGFDHIAGATVIDASGRIYSQVYGEHLTTETLGIPLRQLVLAAPPAAGALPSFEQLFARVRLLCTVYDPDTGEYRYDWSLVLEIIGGLGFFLSVGIYLWRERAALGRRRPDISPVR